MIERVVVFIMAGLAGFLLGVWSARRGKVSGRGYIDFDACAHRCSTCGEALELVRPGKWQCPNDV